MGVKKWIVRKVWPLVSEATRPAVQETAAQVLQQLVPGAVRDAAAPVLRDMVADTLPSATAQSVAAIEAAAQGAATRIQEAASEAARSAREAEQAALRATQLATEEALHSTRQAIDEGLQATRQAADAGLQATRQAADEALQTSRQATEESLQAARQATEEGLQAARKAADEALQTTRQAAEEGLQTTRQAAEEGLQTTRQAAEEARRAGEAAAQDAVRSVDAAAQGAGVRIEAGASAAVHATEAAAMAAMQSLQAASASALDAARTVTRQSVQGAEAAAQRAVRGAEAATQRLLAQTETATQRAFASVEARLQAVAADVLSQLTQSLSQHAAASIESVQRSLAGQLAFAAGHASLLQQLTREKEQWRAQDVPPDDLAQRVRAVVRKHAGLQPLAGEDQLPEEDLLAELRFLWTNSTLVRPMLELCAGRRVLYPGQCYYNLWYLSRALRERGWKADLLNWDGNPASQIYYHGEDFRFNGEPDERIRILRFYVESLYGYDVFHFANMGGISFGWLLGAIVEPVLGKAGEIHLLKALGKKIVYTNNGCHDGVSQTSFSKWGSEPICRVCRWRDDPSVCSDEGNLAWGRFRNSVSDYQCLLGGNRADYNDDPRVHECPWVYCLDPQVWSPDLDVPENLRLAPASGRTVRLYHAVGNKDERTLENGVNIKSSHVYLPLVQKLRGQGWDIELLEPLGVPNKEVRFLQVQADIFLDMLSYGWFGANAREAMMLGKPVVCHIRPEWLESLRRELPEYARDLPIVSATPETVEQVLQDLLSNPQKRAEIGRRSREFMLRWHSSEAAAREFESIYTRLVAGEPLLLPGRKAPSRRVVGTAEA